MPQKVQQLKVSQETRKTDDGTTTLAFSISAPEGDWTLPDILATEGIISTLQGRIEQSAQEYFKAASTILDKLREPKPKEKTKSTSKIKKDARAEADQTETGNLATAAAKSSVS